MKSELEEINTSEKPEEFAHPPQEESGARIQAEYVAIYSILARYVAMDAERL